MRSDCPAGRGHLRRVPLQIRAFIGRRDRSALIILMSARAYHNMVNSLDDMKKEMANDHQLNKVYLGSAIVSSVGLSVGYVVWLLRGGMLLSTLLSSIPAWQILDPLPVLARKRDEDQADDDESLEGIIGPGSAQEKTAEEIGRQIIRCQAGER